MQFLGKVVELPLLCNDRCRGWTVLSRGEVSQLQFIDIPVVVVPTVHGELPQMQFIDGRRSSSCGAEASLVCKLRENR